MGESIAQAGTSSPNDRLLDLLKNPECLRTMIAEATYEPDSCQINESNTIHDLCLHMNVDPVRIICRCPRFLVHILYRVLLSHPEIVDDTVRKGLSEYYKRNKIHAEGLITVEYLKLLHENKKNPSVTWLKFETVLVHLIKEQVYKPKTLANELLVVVKHDLGKDLAAKFASAVSGCVRHCQELKDKGGADEKEDEEKWCQIIDWMSWFLSPGEDDDDV